MLICSDKPIILSFKTIFLSQLCKRTNDKCEYELLLLTLQPQCMYSDSDGTSPFPDIPTQPPCEAGTPPWSNTCLMCMQKTLGSLVFSLSIKHVQTLW